MFSSIFLAATLTTSVSNTEWNYEHQVSSFTNEQSISLEGVNSDQSEILLHCNNKQFKISIFVPTSERLNNQFFAKVDQNLGIKLYAQSDENTITVYRRGIWENGSTLLNQMKKGKKVTFLLDDQGSPTIVEFDLLKNQKNIQTLMEYCGNY